jgi:RHS repeat-associated protein
VYPVVLDPSMQTFEDAWESSGLTPFGQYFQSLEEYVNPANGQLTITQTDLSIPGRGLDLVIARVYEMPALFYEMSPYMGQDPYDYEEPPVNVGKGWQLDFPFVGQQYLHLWGGTFYKIDWSNNVFVNHEGAHFILVKNEDSTYTLTTAGGTVYAFSTTGEVTSMSDLDQNTITFSYTSGVLTSITDTIGRIVSLSYSEGRLWKISYNGNELEYSYDTNGCLLWMEDFLNRRTSYYYNTGYNYWLLSKIVYVTTGYTTYMYDRFSDSGYYKYYVTHQRVFETDQVRHIAYSYTGSFEEITGSTMVVKNESDVNQGYYECTIDDNMITQRVTKNVSGTPIRKVTFAYNSKKETTEQSVYNDGTNLSYTTYYCYDNWGNAIYVKDAEGHEKFFSYANTSTSGFFMDNTGSILRIFSNAFSNSTVPSSVHTAMIGAAERQDSIYVKEMYVTYNSEAHPTQGESAFGNATTWLTFSGTFNEKTGQTSFPIDLTGHTVAGNGVLQITGLPSDDNYQESHSYSCEGQCNANCKSVSGSWQGGSFKLDYKCCRYQLGEVVCALDKTAYIGSFVHYPGTLGYQSYSTAPGMNQMFTTFLVKTFWKAYPAEVQYNLDQSTWKTVTSDLTNGTGQVTTPITDGTHTLYLSESSSYQTKFSWNLYVPVDNAPDTYSTSMTYDTYGNVTTVTDAESNSINLSYSSTHSGAYLTEIAATVGQDTIIARATYDCYRGWVTSIQDPKGVALGSGYDCLFSYDALGRVTKKEFPLLSGQAQRSFLEAVYDDTNRTITIIDQLRHYLTYHYDKLNRLTDVKQYTGEYGSGMLYATVSRTHQYNDLVASVTDPGNDSYTYTYDFLGRCTQIQYPDSSSVYYSFDDTNNKVTFTDGRGYDTIYWYDWISQLTKVEEEYATSLFAITTYQYDGIGHLTSFTDAENRTTTYSYASLFGLTRATYPDSTYEEWAYDDMGNITSFIDAKGNTTSYIYDSIYRLTQIQYEDLSTVSFTYDLNSNRTRTDDNAPDSGDYVEYVYDYWDRLLTETRHISTNTYTVSLEYDEASRVTKLTYPDSMEIVYSYDDLDRITEIKRYVDGSNDEILLHGVQYSEENLLTQFDYGNDLRATFTYDSRDRPLTLDVKNGETAFLDIDYTYDNNSNITQMVNGWRDTSSAWHSQTESYSYDGLDRLTSASSTSWSHTYAYDKVGNRTAKDSVTYTINIVNEVTSLSDGTSFTYDASGNRTHKTKDSDTWDYTYDYADRLTEIKKNSTTIGEYAYDCYGRRIQATENGVTTTYIYSGWDVLYEEKPGGIATYIYGPTGKLAKRTTVNGESHTFYYHTDELRSTRLVTDESKNVVSSITYHPFGEISIKEGSEDYSYSGKELDETGLYYYGARYYDPELGRFITRDVLRGRIANPQTLNRHTYVLNNPLKYTDPNGREIWNPMMKESRSDGEHMSNTGVALIFAYAALIVGSIGIALIVPGVGTAVAGIIGTAAFAALCSILTSVDLALAFVALYLIVKDRDEFGVVLADWQRVYGIQDKDLSKTEYNEEGTEVTVTLKDGRKFIFRWTEDGWVVEEVKEEDPASEDPASEDSSNSSDSSNSGSSSSGGTQAGSRSYAC